jgi:hypothetical protein
VIAGEKWTDKTQRTQADISSRRYSNT